MKTDLFQSCGHCWVFQICWHIECSTFTASFFRIWNSSTGIPSPPLALFLPMLSKAHLTSHSRMSGSRWVITPSWLSGSGRSFLYSSSVYSCHLFLISSAYVRFIPFLSFIVPILEWNVPLVSNFLRYWRDLQSFPFYYFPLFLCIVHLGRLFKSLLAFVWNSAFRWVYISFFLCLSLLFFIQLFERPPQTAILPFCISFSWVWSWSLPPIQCYEPPSIVLHALLSIRSSLLNLFVTSTV